MILASSEAQVRATYRHSLSYVEKVGLAEVLGAQRRTFRENKEKLGLERAWPGES
jgi:hypothetical protein